MEILIAFYYICALFCLIYFFSSKFITSTNIFLVAQAIFFAGIVPLLDFNSFQDKKIVMIYILGLISFGLGAYIGEKKFHYNKKNIIFSNAPLKNFQKHRITCVILVSALLFAFFCYKTRFSTLSKIFSNFFSGGSYNVTEDRLQSYLVPGTAYIYLFRIVFLPTVVVAMLKKEYKYSIITKVVCVAFMIVFSLATGQRGGFVMIIFMWLLSFMIQFFYAHKIELKKKAIRKIAVIFVLFLVVFGLMSKANGRVSGSIIGEIIQRFMQDNQDCAVIAFHYIFKEGSCWGRNFYEEIVNLILPGEKYMPISSIIFSILYGSTRGTAPPCLWGYVFYNFSWLGVAIFGFLYGLLNQYISFRLFSREITGLRCALYSYMFINLGMLVTGGPLQLFNNGFIPLIFLGYILHVDKYCKKITNKENTEQQNCTVLAKN